MSEPKEGISRRCFLDQTARAWLAMGTAKALPVPLSAIERAEQQQASGERPHRYIDASKCIGCESCIPLCPLGAISISEGVSSIDPSECAECGTCTRAGVCPTDALTAVRLGWPRSLRETFSNPLAIHESTGIMGRGTEGIKSNDSQNRYRRGEIGVFIELGRPVLGSRFTDVERVVKKFKSRGYDVIPNNPISALIADQNTGALRPEILDEKIISCVLEFVIPDSAAGDLMEMVDQLAREVDTVFGLSVALRADDRGRSNFRELFGPDVYCMPNAKLNIGMAENIA